MDMFFLLVQNDKFSNKAIKNQFLFGVAKDDFGLREKILSFPGHFSEFFYLYQKPS